jgi:uncharacterized membrane protein
VFIIAKDKVIGLVIMIVGILIAVIYTLGSIVDLFLSSAMAGAAYNPQGFVIPIPGLPDLFSWELFVVAPLWLIVILICVIAIWIGYSMLTTPAPVPLEELEEELAAEEAAA